MTQRKDALTNMNIDGGGEEGGKSKINAKGEIKKKQKRKKKDPNAPKRHLSAYMYFAKEKREELVLSNPALKSDIAQMGKIIGSLWSKANAQEKQKYENMAMQDKIRYEKQKEEYNNLKKSFQLPITVIIFKWQ